MNKISIMLGISFLIVNTNIASIDPITFFTALGYPPKVVERRMRMYASKAPFSAESQCMVDMIFDHDLFALTSQKNLIPAEMVLFAEAVKGMNEYKAESIREQKDPFFAASRDFFSHPVLVEAYLFLIGKEPGTEIKRRGAASKALLMAMYEDAPTKTIELILARGADVNSIDVQSNTALIIAAHKGRSEIAQLLLVSGADGNRANKQGQTALSLALMHVHSDIVESLLDCGALIGRYEKGEDIALNLIVEKSKYNPKKYENIAIFLIERGASVNNTKGDMPPLMRAVRDNNYHMAQILINHGAAINVFMDGTSPLRLAFKQNDQEMFNLLIVNGADINGVDMCGETILHAAIRDNNLGITEKLFKLGATPNTVNNAGWTPLAEAAVRGYEKMTQLILEHEGWKMAYHPVDGKLPQDLAREQGHMNIFGMIAGYY